jgi:hypothetical protein
LCYGWQIRSTFWPRCPFSGINSHYWYLTATGFLLIFGIAGLLAQELIGFIDFMVCSLNLENTTYNVLPALQAAPTFDGTQIYSHLLLANLISCS